MLYYVKLLVIIEILILLKILFIVKLTVFILAVALHSIACRLIVSLNLLIHHFVCKFMGIIRSRPWQIYLTMLNHLLILIFKLLLFIIIKVRLSIKLLCLLIKNFILKLTSFSQSWLLFVHFYLFLISFKKSRSFGIIRIHFLLIFDFGPLILLIITSVFIFIEHFYKNNLNLFLYLQFFI